MSRLLSECTALYSGAEHLVELDYDDKLTRNNILLFMLSQTFFFIYDAWKKCEKINLDNYFCFNLKIMFYLYNVTFHALLSIFLKLWCIKEMKNSYFRLFISDLF